MQVVSFEVVRTSATTFALKFQWVNDDTGKPASVGFRWGATQPADRLTLTGKRDYIPTTVAVIGQTFQSPDIAIPTSQPRTYFTAIPYRLSPTWTTTTSWSPYKEVVWASLPVPGTQPPPPPPPPPPVVDPPPPPPVVVPQPLPPSVVPPTLTLGERGVLTLESGAVFEGHAVKVSWPGSPDVHLFMIRGTTLTGVAT
jgi:hypothetical protein